MTFLYKMREERRERGRGEKREKVEKDIYYKQIYIIYKNKFLFIK